MHMSLESQSWLGESIHIDVLPPSDPPVIESRRLLITIPYTPRLLSIFLLLPFLWDYLRRLKPVQQNDTTFGSAQSIYFCEPASSLNCRILQNDGCYDLAR